MRHLPIPISWVVRMRLRASLVQIVVLGGSRLEDQSQTTECQQSERKKARLPGSGAVATTRAAKTRSVKAVSVVKEVPSVLNVLSNGVPPGGD